jgi:hypothetical protein
VLSKLILCEIPWSPEERFGGESKLFLLNDGAYRTGENNPLISSHSEGSLLSPNANSSGFKLLSLFDWTLI